MTGNLRILSAARKNTGHFSPSLGARCARYLERAQNGLYFFQNLPKKSKNYSRKSKNYSRKSEIPKNFPKFQKISRKSKKFPENPKIKNFPKIQKISWKSKIFRKFITNFQKIPNFSLKNPKFFPKIRNFASKIQIYFLKLS